MTVNITDSIGNPTGEQEDLTIYIECSKRNETNLQCVGAGDTQSSPTNYLILPDGTIKFIEDPIFRGTLLENGILIWYANGTLMDYIYRKQGIFLLIEK